MAKSISLGGGTSCRKSSRRIVFTVVRKGDLRILTLGDRGRGESVANVRSAKALRDKRRHFTENLASEYPPRLMIAPKNTRNRLLCIDVLKFDHRNPRGRSMPHGCCRQVPATQKSIGMANFLTRPSMRKHRVLAGSYFCGYSTEY